MRDLSSSIFLVEKTRLDEPTRVLRNRFYVSPERLSNFFHGYTALLLHEEQDVDPPVVRNPLEVPLHLLACL